AGAVRGRTAQLTLPSGATRILELAPTADRLHVRFAGTQQPGRYTLRVPMVDGDEQVIHFIVQAPLDEADPTTLELSRLEWIAKTLGAQRVEADKASLAAIVNEKRSGRELYLPL